MLWRRSLPNDVKLQEGHPVDENLRPLKVGGKSTAIETAQDGDGARVRGDLNITGTLKPANMYSIDSDGDLILDTVGDIILDAFSSHVYIGSYIDFDLNGSGSAGASMKLMSILDTGDYFMIDTTTHGATTISTVDDDATAANLTLDVDGDITLDAAGENIILKGSSGSGLEFVQHHGGSFYIRNLTQDKHISVRVNKGGVDTEVMQITGAEPCILFNSTGVGFARQEATFSTTGVIGSGGTDDTDIDFRLGNKFRLELTGDITNVNLIFPTASGNFLLVCTTNGDHDVTNWKVYESDESAATTGDVMWAGGSVPAFTNNGIDIVSFYWDATEQQAYGVASLAFATP